MLSGCAIFDHSNSNHVKKEPYTNDSIILNLTFDSAAIRLLKRRSLSYCDFLKIYKTKSSFDSFNYFNGNAFFYKYSKRIITKTNVKPGFNHFGFLPELIYYSNDTCYFNDIYHWKEKLGCSSIVENLNYMQSHGIKVQDPDSRNCE